MKRWREVLAVLFLLFIAVMAVVTGWQESMRIEEEQRGAGTKEEWIEQRLDDWILKMP